MTEDYFINVFKPIHDSCTDTIIFCKIPVDTDIDSIYPVHVYEYLHEYFKLDKCCNFFIIHTIEKQKNITYISGVLLRHLFSISYLNYKKSKLLNIL